MLTHLSIRNYALINNLDIGFSDGLSIITGETGSGKSILLGALSLIFGQRADSSVLNDKNQKCIVEGTMEIKKLNLENIFDENNIDYDESTIIRREILPNGKSRAFINDTPVNVSVLKILSGLLIDIHSQHENQMLFNSSFQMKVIDTIAGNDKLFDDYRKTYTRYNYLLNEHSLLEAEHKRILSEQDYLKFQYEELEGSNIKENELELLESELEALTHAEEIKTAFSVLSERIAGNDSNMLSATGEMKNCLDKIAHFNAGAADLLQRLNSIYIELKDIAGEAESLSDKIDVSSERMNEATERIDSINRLLNKHHLTSTADLISLINVISEKLENINSHEEKLTKLSLEISEYHNKLKNIAAKLSAERKKTVPEFERSVLSSISQLGISNAAFKVKIYPVAQFTPYGTDTVEFMFSANGKEYLNDISKVASGGEISRVMLCLKSIISKKLQLPTIVFDEIDAGISGETAAKAGNIIKEISEKIQVINITHLPQIAIKGKHHYKVYKVQTDSKTEVNIKLLNNEERKLEIAQMLSGEKISNTAIKHADELLKKN